ncbi:MAG TPA: FecR family protein [Gammaproteobacteria bacterium]
MSDDSDSRDDIGRLIRSAGRGPAASAEARTRIYAAAHAAWRRSVGERRAPRRPLVWLAAAAGVVALVAAALVLNLALEPAPPGGPVLGSFVRVEGPAELVSAGQQRRLRSQATGVPIRAGDLLRTGAGGRAAVDLSPGFVLRINGQSAVRFTSSELLALERGTLYIDTGASGIAPALEVRTSLGRVRHLGTQYEVSVNGRTVRVRVREGEVMFRDGTREVRADAGEQVSIDATGEPVRSAFAPYDPAWGWVESLAVLRSASDATVSELLDWAGRERGLTVRYASAATEVEAARLTLHGVDGLTPAEALDVIEGTTSMRYVERDGELIVSTER